MPAWQRSAGSGRACPLASSHRGPQGPRPPAKREEGSAAPAANHTLIMHLTLALRYVWVNGDYAGRVQGAAYSLQDPDRPQQLALQASRWPVGVPLEPRPAP